MDREVGGDHRVVDVVVVVVVLVRRVHDDARVAGRLGVAQRGRVARSQSRVHAAVDPARVLLVGGVAGIGVTGRVVVVVRGRRR